eukprot:g1890.t1
MDSNPIRDDFELRDEQMLDLESSQPPMSSNVAKESRIRAMELEVLSDRERRERCLQPVCHGENIRLTKELKEIQRTEEIRSFLSAYSQTNSKATTQLDQSTLEHNRVYKFISEVPGTPFSVTSALNGDRVYCTRRHSVTQCSDSKSAQSASILPSISVDEIREKMEQSRIQSPEPYSDEKGVNGEYWVHKYAPRSFSDLITDDRINRELVKWLKNWKPQKTKPRPTETSKTKPERSVVENKQTSMKTPSAKDSNKRITDYFSTPDERSPSGNATPSAKGLEERVMILCGPLGTGKTSLAKTACRICGYTPFTIDSSDDRSPLALQKTLSEVLEMDACFEARIQRCVIFDEVDTFPNGVEGRDAIKLIVSFIRGRKKGSILKRPMIFICSEIFGAHLTPLRKVAKVLYVPQVKINKCLVIRLQKICSLEKVVVDLPDLHRLVEESRNDISSCLNTLQFQSRCTQVSGVSTKMLKISPFKVWESILLPHPTNQDTFDDLSMQYEAFGDFVLLLNGIFTNYASLKIHDGFLIKSRSISSLISKSSQFLRTLPMYCSTYFLAIRALVTSPDREVRLEWPRKEFENIRQININSSHLQSFLIDIPPKVNTWTSLSIHPFVPSGSISC